MYTPRFGPSREIFTHFGLHATKFAESEVRYFMRRNWPKMGSTRYLCADFTENPYDEFGRFWRKNIGPISAYRGVLSSNELFISWRGKVRTDTNTRKYINGGDKE